MTVSRAKFNENGELVNSLTGEPIGVRSGNGISINSNGAEPFTLDDYGVGLPDFPDDSDDMHRSRDDDDSDFADSGMGNVAASMPNQAEKSVQDIVESSEKRGPTSFPVQKTKYEITKDSYFVIRFGLLEESDGRFIPLRNDQVEHFPMAERHWVKFRMWSYREELAWKSEFLEYNPMAKSKYLNLDKLNERKIRRLMLDWSFGEFNDRLKLLHCDGTLSDESYSVFMGLYPSIAGTIVDMMNAVLESNQ